MKTKPTRVLIINKYFDVLGGIEESVRHLALIKNPNLDITVLACSKRNTQKSTLKFSARIIRCSIIAIILRTPFSFSFIPRLVYEAFRTDVIHMHMPYPFGELLIALLIPFLYKKKIVITYHTDIVKQKLLIKIYYCLVRIILNRVQQIVVTSPALALQSTVLQPFNKKITVIPLAVLTPDKIKQPNYQQLNYGLFVGRLVYYKGLRYLLEAWQNINIPLIIVGDGPMREELQTLAKKLYLDDLVQWKLRVDDTELWKLYEEASFFVFPSTEITEALGLAQINALACGLPIINTSLPTGVPWVARHNSEAITVEPKNISELHDAIKKITNDPILRKHLGSAGRQRYEELFTISHFQDQWEKIYLQGK